MQSVYLKTNWQGGISLFDTKATILKKINVLFFIIFTFHKCSLSQYIFETDLDQTKEKASVIIKEKVDFHNTYKPFLA